MNVECPTDDELIINEKLFGNCNHLSFICESTHTKEDRDEFEYKYLVCKHCSQRFEHPKEGASYLDFKDIPESYLATKIHRYSDDPIMGELVLRKIDELGWSLEVSKSSGGTRCLLSSDSKIIKGDIYANEQIAISSAAAKLAATL